MPTYEYHCPACKATYELRQGFEAEATHTCEECGKGTARRILSAPAVVFKGSGWYATDSRNRKSAVSESSSESTGGSKESRAAEPAAPPSKPAAGGSGAEAAAAS